MQQKITLIITKENFRNEELPHALFLTTRQITEIRKTYANNMSTDIKLSKAQLCKIIHSGGFLCKTLGNIIGYLGKKALLNLAGPLAKDVLSKLATKSTSSVLDKVERKKFEKERQQQVKP